MPRGVERDLAAGDASILVWDPLVRIVHWTVAVGCFLNLFILETGTSTTSSGTSRWAR
jgi:cytochrome b